MKKLPLHSEAGRESTAWAASAMISGVRLTAAIASPPRAKRTAAVSIDVIGQSELTPTLPRNSAAMPSVHRLIPYFAVV